MIQRRTCLRWAVGLLGAGVVPATCGKSRETLVWRERAMVGFGTTLWLKAAHTNADLLEAGLQAAVAAIRRVEWEMSLFDPDSALSRLNRQGQLRAPAPHLWAVLHRARMVSSVSDGAFDVSMQPLWQLWSQAASQGALPSARMVSQTRQRVNWRAIETSSSSIRLNLPGMKLSLNGIAQGYAADLVRKVLQSVGIDHALIDTGETTLLGQAPGQRAWTLGIEDAARHPSSPEAPPSVVSDGRAMATSSDAHTVFSADHRHHHIVDPHTGYSPTVWSSVTVLAPTCVMADALTKVFFMLAPAQVLPAAQRWQVDVILQDKAGRWTSTLVHPLAEAHPDRFFNAQV